MEIAIVKFFQSMANSFLDVFFWLVTKIGEETFFLIAFVGIYLCYDKFFAVKYIFYYLMSVGVNSLMKFAVKRPRPYVASNEIINRLPASNYSFPSGHSQGYFVQVSTGMIEVQKKCNKSRFKIFLLIGFILVGVLVMISRMYWGQHYLSDVVAGMMFGIGLPFVLEWVFKLIPPSFKEKFTTDRLYLLIGFCAICVACVCFILDFSMSFYSKRVYKFTAVILSLSFGYFVESRYIHFNPKQGWIWGIFKFAISVIVLAGGYWILTSFIPLQGYFYFVVYFVLGLVGTIVLPAIFKIISLKDKR